MTDNLRNPSPVNLGLRSLKGTAAPERGHSFDIQGAVKTFLESPEGRAVLRKALKDIDEEEAA